MKIRPDLLSPRADPPPVQGIWIMAGSVICFTCNSLLLKYLSGYRQIDPSVALLFRAVVGAVVVVLFMKGRRPLELRPIFCDRLLVSRGITGVLGTAAYYYTVVGLGPGKATIISITYVLFAAIFAVLFLKERLGLARVGWMVLAFAGMVLLVEGGGNLTPEPNRFDQIIALGGAIMAAITVVLIRQLTFRYSNATIFMAQCLWIAIPVLPFCFGHFGNLALGDYGVLSVAAVLAAVGQLLMNEGYRRLPVASGGSIQMTWPLATSLGGWLLFGELFGVLQIVGAVMILFGTWKVAVGGPRR